ncbi:MAG: hypothetical protein ACRDOL_33545 [Streptosporangiaceae bacterium]
MRGGVELRGINVPATAAAGSYSSTINVAISSGPDGSGLSDS